MPIRPDRYACPYCGEAGAGATSRDAEFLRCARCGVLRLRQPLEPLEQQRMIEERYGSIPPPTPVLNCRGLDTLGGPSPEEAAMLRSCCDDLLSGGRALDIGAGIGDFVSCLTHLGMRASGLEAFAPSAAAGRSYGLDVRDGRFDAETLRSHFGDERFDLISLRESLYYLHLGQAFGLIRERLVPNGALYIKTHVAESPYYWRGMKLTDRLGKWVSAFYSTETLTGVLRHRQFDIVALRRASMSPAQAAKGWAIPSALAARAIPLLARFLPPDRVHILARMPARPQELAHGAIG